MRSGSDGFPMWLGMLVDRYLPRMHPGVVLGACAGAGPHLPPSAPYSRLLTAASRASAIIPMIGTGLGSPLGARVSGAGVNFSVFSRQASSIELLLFDRDDDERPALTIRLDPAINRTYHYWHAFVPDLRPGQIYGYRVEGPFIPEAGLPFDPTKVLLDPYGRGVVVPKNYCQDTEISWFDWALLEQHADIHRFVSLLAARRLLRDVEAERRRLSLNDLLHEAKTVWHGVKLYEPDFRACSRSIALSMEIRRERLFLHLILNAYWEPLEFQLPQIKDGDRVSWLRWIDTSLPSPLDIVEWQTAESAPGYSYRAGPRSVVVIFARPKQSCSNAGYV